MLSGPEGAIVKYSISVASDVIRNGLGLELESETGEILAEVFRCDENHTVVVDTFGNSIPSETLSWLLENARVELEPFEDGVPLPKASEWRFRSSSETQNGTVQ